MEDRKNISSNSESGMSYDLANAIKKLRRQKEINQMNIAEKLGISQPNYARIESGRTNLSFETIFKIVNAMNASTDELFKFYPGLKPKIEITKEGKRISREYKKLKKDRLDLKNSLDYLTSKVDDKSKPLPPASENILNLDLLLNHQINDNLILLSTIAKLVLLVMSKGIVKKEELQFVDSSTWLKFRNSTLLQAMYQNDLLSLDEIKKIEDLFKK